MLGIPFHQSRASMRLLRGVPALNLNHKLHAPRQPGPAIPYREFWGFGPPKALKPFLKTGLDVVVPRVSITGPEPAFFFRKRAMAVLDGESDWVFTGVIQSEGDSRDPRTRSSEFRGVRSSWRTLNVLPKSSGDRGGSKLPHTAARLTFLHFYCITFSYCEIQAETNGKMDQSHSVSSHFGHFL